MRIIRLACILAALGAVAGCESASSRSDIGSVEVQDVASPAVAFVADRVAAGSGAPVFVESSGPFMPFGAAYHDYLVSQLAQAGVPLSSVRGTGLTVRYQVQPLVAHELGHGNVVITTQVLDNGPVVWSDTAEFEVPASEMINFAAWTPRPAPVVRPFSAVELPVKPMAITGPGVADERAERIFRRSLRK